ncbi:MAG TPA: hypothetical protein VGS19_23130 [Streptosporangiaceae bacterium]|nr:hypothetical protein [Streptosporangiaceae bacterium]
MDQDHNWKQQLPYPYNQDLSGVLRHLNRRTPFSRAKLANDPATAGYLAAALRLVQRHIGPGATRELADPDDANSVDRPLLRFLSQREVVAAVAGNPDPFPRRGSVAALRSTWRSQSDFIADVLAFALWPGHLPAEYYGAVADWAERLLDGPDFTDAVHGLAYFEMSTVLRMPALRFKWVAMAEAEGDSTIRAALPRIYSSPLDLYKQLYGAVVNARGLKLRPGVTQDDLANILVALSDGLMTRAVCDPGAGVIDHEQGTSLLGKAALAIIFGCLERREHAENLTLEQAVHALIYDRPGAGGDVQ